MTLKVIHRLQVFSNAIRQTFMQHFTRFQLTACSHGFSALAELLVSHVTTAQCRDPVARLNSTQLNWTKSRQL